MLAASGHHELEASVMTSDGRCGAVALVKHVSNPIKLAQQVRQQAVMLHLSRHGAAADKLSRLPG